MSTPPDPWVRISRRTVYENPWIQVHHDEVTRPDGSPGIYGVVHFRAMAVGAVVLDADGRVLLVGQHRYPLDRYSWEIPEGGADRDEDPLDGARRELAEETGFTARSWSELIRFSLSNSATDEEGVLFVATDLEAGEASPDPTEKLRVRWVGLDEALAMVASGEIHDMITQVGLLAYDRART
ncbi:MAG: NUDIX hydrolase [Actinobacteria bacterium]|nr:NUDIX hydrolase [Actinomycetota bacterium]